MEDNFRKLSAKVWAHLDNPIKSYDISATICDVTTVQPSNGTVHKFHKILLFMKIYLPPTFIFTYVRPKMIVHAFMIKLDKLDY